MALDWQAIGTGVGGLAVGAGGVLAWWRRRAAEDAKILAEVAESGAKRSVSDAERTLYALLAKQIETLNTKVDNLEKENQQERQHRRELETHVFHLENLMRAANLQPPERVRMMG